MTDLQGKCLRKWETEPAQDRFQRRASVLAVFEGLVHVLLVKY
jgi:hypothetical protein